MPFPVAGTSQEVPHPTASKDFRLFISNLARVTNNAIAGTCLDPDFHYSAYPAGKSGDQVMDDEDALVQRMRAESEPGRARFEQEAAERANNPAYSMNC